MPRKIKKIKRVLNKQNTQARKYNNFVENSISDQLGKVFSTKPKFPKRR